MGEALQDGGPGATYVLTVERPAGSTNRIELEIETVPAPDDSGRAVIGVVPDERIVEFDLPIAVRLASVEVGGPASGLLFTRALLVVLPERLTGGRRIGND